MMLTTNLQSISPLSPHKRSDAEPSRFPHPHDSGLPFYAQLPYTPSSHPRSSSFALPTQNQSYTSTLNSMAHMAASLPQYITGPIPSISSSHTQHRAFVGQPSLPLFIPAQGVPYHPHYSHGQFAGNMLSMQPQQMFAPSQYSAFAPQFPMQPANHGIAGSHASYMLADGMISPTTQYSDRVLGFPASDSYTSAGPHASFSSISSSSAVAPTPSLLDMSAQAAIPRGPPRKPRQSGHALWVGNLPMGTQVIDLKDHFSRDMCKDIESVKLISKSNCAFVNYRSQQACTAAVHKFHDSRFHGVRLVCRLRRPSVPTPPSPSDAPVSPVTRTANPGDGTNSAEDVAKSGDANVERSQDIQDKIPAKYFILKSLTLSDLELSIANGIWATQSHNEAALNDAFKVMISITSRVY